MYFFTLDYSIMECWSAKVHPYIVDDYHKCILFQDNINQYQRNHMDMPNYKFRQQTLLISAYFHHAEKHVVVLNNNWIKANLTRDLFMINQWKIKIRCSRIILKSWNGTSCHLEKYFELSHMATIKHKFTQKLFCEQTISLWKKIQTQILWGE